MNYGKKPRGEKKKNNRIKDSFAWAWEGLMFGFRTQRNMRIHGIAALLVVLVALLFRLSPVEFLIVLTAIFMVLIAEAVNTAIESAIDLFSPRYHPVARNAKNAAAGAVLLSAIFSLVVAGFVFGPRFVALFMAWGK